MSNKSKKRPPTREVTLNKAVGHALVIFFWAFVVAFDPTDEQVEILKHEMQSVRDSVLSGALTIPQIRKALRDEYNWEVS